MATRMTVDSAAIRVRHPHHFSGPSRSRQLTMAMGIAAVLLLLFGMAQLGFFDGKFQAGLGKLGEIAGLMLPPNPGDWAIPAGAARLMDAQQGVVPAPTPPSDAARRIKTGN